MKVNLPGTHLGQFEVVSYLMTGDVCIEYTCLDRVRACPALLKALRPELLASQTARDSFVKSGLAWVGLGTHPHIAHCHTLWQPENSDQAYLVVEAVIPEKERDDSSLLSWLIPGSPLPVLQALLFALQIARGMQYVTNKIPGFVHGDLKPESVLVSGGRLSQAHVNRLRVTDFGLSAVLQAADINRPELKETTAGRTQLIQGMVGTPLYMSPEQWRGEIVTMATDVYALGCLLYKMLVGRHPVAGETVQALRNAHCTGNIRPLPVMLPETVRDLTTRCLALERRERYQSWEEVEWAIAAAYADTVHYPVPAAELTDTPTRSERALEGWFLNSMGCVSTEAGNVDTAIACLELALKAGGNEGDQALVGTSLSNLGEAYLRQGDTLRAIEHHEKALRIAGEIGDRTVEGPALNGLGTDNLQLGNPRQAIQYFEKALVIAREIHDRRGEMAALVNMGNVYHQMGDLHRAIQYFEQELEIARRLGDRRGESSALANLGGVYSDLGDNKRAIKCQEQSLAIKSEIGDRHSQIASLNNLANAYRNLGDARQAFDNYNKALEIALEIGDRRGEAFALNNIGSTYSNLGNMESALKYHEQALEIFREIGDRRSQGDCLTNLGFIYKSRNDTERALQCCEQALTIDREVGDMLGLALDSFNMANLLAGLNRFREALSYAEESAQILEKVGHPDKAPQARELAAQIRTELASQTPGAERNAATAPADFLSQQIQQVRQDNPTLTAKMSDQEILALLQQSDQAIANDRPTVFMVQPPKDAQQMQTANDNQDFEKKSMDELIVLGQQLVYDGHWQDAERAFHVLLKKANQASHVPYQSLGLLLQGRLHSDRGDQPQALNLFRQALSLAKYTNDLKMICQIHDSTGIAYTRQGSYKEAIEHHRYAIEICEHIGDEQGVILSQANLGNAYRAQGDLEQAARAYKDLLDYTLRIGAQQTSAQAYCNLGLVYHKQGLRDLAIEMQLKSLEIALRLGDQLTASSAYGNLGTLRAELGDYPTAVQMVRKALEIEERLGIEPEIAQKYADLASLYTKMGELMQAFLSYDRALIYYERIGDHSNLAKIHFNMGNLYRQQGKTAQAREQFQQSQAIFESIGELENAKRAAGQWR
jgi:tetratricopeptide (TPR) repeat protein